MPNIKRNKIKRSRIIVGPVRRFEIDGEDVGATRGDVIVRRVVSQLDILTDIGVVVDKFRLQDRFFVDVNLAEATFENLKIVWGGDIEETLDDMDEVEGHLLHLRHWSMTELTRSLVLEGPDVNGLIQNYTFPRVVSLSQISQTFGKEELRSIPVTFEALAEIRNFSTNVGLEGTTVIKDWVQGLVVVKNEIVVDENDVLWVAVEADGGATKPSENSHFEKYDAATHNRVSFGFIAQRAFSTSITGAPYTS